MQRFVKLSRIEGQGYKPDVCDWGGYVVPLNTRILAHDLYHHQQYEFGTPDEEIRASGAEEYFEPHSGTQSLSDLVKNFYKRHIEVRDNNANYLGGIIRAPKKFRKLVYVDMDVGYGEYLVGLLVKGWEHAKTHNHKAYNKVRHYKHFVTHYEKGKDLVVDLKTGNIKEI